MEQKIKLLDIVKTDDDSKKKYTAIFQVDNKIKKVSFGAKGFEDYTTHKDVKRREAYLSRHQRDNLENPLSPGALSWFILWGPSTDINRNIEFFRRRFRI